MEGNAGTTIFTFTVTRTVTTGAASVQAATSDGTATAGSDYVAVPLTTLNFADGVATQPFAVTVNGDAVFEGAETFNVTLSNPSAGNTIGDGLGVGTIGNDDVATAPGAVPVPAGGWPAWAVLGMLLLLLGASAAGRGIPVTGRR